MNELSIAFNIIVFICNVLIFVVIKFNDLKHLSEDMKEIKRHLDNISRKINKVDKVQVTMQAVCSERHRNRRIK
jgi:hypothetical protein